MYGSCGRNHRIMSHWKRFEYPAIRFQVFPFSWRSPCRIAIGQWSGVRSNSPISLCLYSRRSGLALLQLASIRYHPEHLQLTLKSEYANRNPIHAAIRRLKREISHREIIITAPNILKDGKRHSEVSCPKKEFDSPVLPPIQGLLKWIKTVGNLRYFHKRLIFLNSRI